ncbi:hypothetical protein TKK_0008146 [Trichogramma kaykai]
MNVHRPSNKLQEVVSHERWAVDDNNVSYGKIRAMCQAGSRSRLALLGCEMEFSAHPRNKWAGIIIFKSSRSPTGRVNRQRDYFL